MKKTVAFLLSVVCLSACAANSDSQIDMKTTSAKETSISENEPADYYNSTTTKKEEKYVDGLYSVNHTYMTLHRSGCSEQLKDSGDYFDVIYEEEAATLYNNGYTLCDVCNPEFTLDDVQIARLTTANTHRENNYPNYIINDNTKTVHTPNCYSLPNNLGEGYRTVNTLDIDSIKSQGYKAFSHCRPF